MAYKRKKIQFAAYHFDLLPVWAKIPPETAGKLFLSTLIDAARYAEYEGEIPEPPELPIDVNLLALSVEARTRAVIDAYKDKCDQNAGNRNGDSGDKNSDSGDN